MTAIKSEYFVDEATGQRYVMSKLGGTTNANGDDAANVVLSSANNSYIQMDLSGTTTDVSEIIFRTGAGANLAEAEAAAIYGIYVVINPTSDTDAKNKLFAGKADFIQAGREATLGAGGVDVAKVAILGVSNKENGSSFGTSTRVAGTAQRTATMTSVSTVATIMVQLIPESTIKGIKLSLSRSEVRGNAFGEFNADMVCSVRGIA